MSGADFYTKIGSKLEWIGSIPRNGNPTDIPVIILLKVNKMDYEESVIDFLNKSGGNTNDWPWEYKDSRMTEFSYVFDNNLGKVYMCIFGCGAVDPIKLVQGEDIKNACIDLFVPEFPCMKNPPENVIDLEKRRRQNERKSAKNV